MTRYHVLTTCSRAGWEQTGRRMAESFVKHWPAEALPLTIYAEGFDPEPMPGITVKRLPDWLRHFKEDNRTRNGMMNGKGYNYVFDAVKFAHKVAAVTDFGLGLSDGVMIWLDADTFTHADVTGDWLEGLFPAPSYIAWLDRTGTHPECGFVMYRCGHLQHANVMKSYRSLYTNGTLFSLPRWDDCTALAQIITAMHRTDRIEAPVSLSGPGTSTHPMANGPISECCDHLKGNRKLIGRTPKDQRKIKDGNPYWA